MSRLLVLDLKFQNTLTPAASYADYFRMRSFFHPAHAFFEFSECKENAFFASHMEEAAGLDGDA